MTKTTKMITLTNDFHGTTTRVRVSADIDVNAEVEITERQARRAIRTLCGVSGCCCGGSRGGRYSLYHDQASGVAWIEDTRYC
jgi:hypothetical protein